MKGNVKVWVKYFCSDHCKSVVDHLRTCRDLDQHKSYCEGAHDTQLKGNNLYNPGPDENVYDFIPDYREGADVDIEEVSILWSCIPNFSSNTCSLN